jgi:hypothetical protein
VKTSTSEREDTMKQSRLVLRVLAAFLFCLQTGSSLQANPQGLVSFFNSTRTAFIDNRTGLPAASGKFYAGLYYSLDLGATEWEEFNFVDGSRANVMSGLFIGGTEIIPSTMPGQMVLLQVRTWEQAYETLEMQFASGRGDIGFSKIMSLTLGGGVLPTPSLTAQGGLESFGTFLIPEPSMLAFGLLGTLGGIFLARRRPQSRLRTGPGRSR